MKKLIVLVMSVSLALSVSAQRSGKLPQRNPRPAQKVVVVRPYPMFSPYMGFGRFGGFGRPFFGFPPYGFGYDYGFNRYQSRPTKLDIHVEDIQHEFRERIASVRRDNELTRKERRDKVRELKARQEREISEARKSYYKTDVRG